MKKALLIILIVLVVITISLFLKDINDEPTNFLTNTSETNTIIINEVYIFNDIEFSKVELFLQNKILKLYYNSNNYDNGSMAYSISIYNELYELIENINISNLDNNNDFIILKYNNDMSKASHYSINMIFTTTTG